MKKRLISLLLIGLMVVVVGRWLIAEIWNPWAVILVIALILGSGLISAFLVGQGGWVGLILAAMVTACMDLGVLAAAMVLFVMSMGKVIAIGFAVVLTATSLFGLALVVKEGGWGILFPILFFFVVAGTGYAVTQRRVGRI